MNRPLYTPTLLLAPIDSPAKAMREERANGEWAPPIPLALWSLYNCYPDCQLNLPGHLLSLVSCSADFGPWRWRQCVLPKLRFIYGLQGAISHKMIIFIKAFIAI
jgi:hypothetical protein